jgi:CSLREA domain-containing protein
MKLTSVSRTCLRIASLVLTLLLGIVIGPVRTAFAATITVNTTSDDFTDNTLCSLREALIAANTNSNLHENACKAGSNNGTDTIMLAAGAIYSLTIDGAGENAAATGDLDVLNNSAAIDVILRAKGSGALIQQNSAAGDRVLHIMTGGSMQINNLTISSGDSVTQGGAIYFSDATLVITNSTIAASSAADGGGIYNDTGTLTLNDSIVMSNTATNNGGGIYSSGPTTVTFSNLVDNTAANLGGGVYVASSTFNFNDSFAVTNQSTTGAGIHNLGQLVVDNSQLLGNTAETTAGDGGGLFNAGLGTATLQNGSIVTNDINGPNTASAGGGIYNAGTLTIDASTVSNNEANLHGGGIENSGTLTVQNGSAIVSNQSPFGGGIANTGTATINDSEVSNNVATISGAGIETSNSLTINNSDFVDNAASASGGAILAINTLNITNGDFTGNSAGNNGGAIHTGGQLQANTSSFIGNSATGEGDAVYTDTTTVNATQVTTSCITGNGDTAVYNNQMSSQNFTMNWWGAATGPTHAGNPGGTGDSVSNFIDYGSFETTESEACVDNVLTNGSFENGTVGAVPDNWIGKKLVLNSMADGIDTDGADVNHGAQSWRFVGDGNGSKLYQDVLISGDQGDSYTLNFDAAGFEANGGGTFRVTLQFTYTDGKKGTFKFNVPGGSEPYAGYMINATAAKPYDMIRVTLQYTKKQGYAFFDHFVLFEN